MAKAKTLRVKMLAHLASPDPAEERLVGEEYAIPAAQAERLFDFGLCEIVDPAWKARDVRGPEAYETRPAAPVEISAPAEAEAAETADAPPSDEGDELRDAGDAGGAEEE